MNKILGLDLGTNSIGWALRSTDLPENQIDKFGVITFNKGVGSGKTGEYSFAAERTKRRSTRRLYQARKYRLWATLEILITNGFCPLEIENLNKWRHYSKEEAVKNNNGGRVYPVNDLAFDQWIKLDFDGDGSPDFSSPYQLRKELAETRLDFNKETSKMKLGRALYHIAQRRGFKSSRKSADDGQEKQIDNEEEIAFQYSEQKKADELKKIFPDFDASKPVSVFLAEKERQGFRVRKEITHYLVRENYKNEVRHIFEFQDLGLDHSLFKQLVETGRNRNDGSIFYKRPLRSQKGSIGKCTLEPGKYRVPVSHPSFELFRAWSFINNIKFKDIGDDGGSWKPLPLDLKYSIFNEKFFRKSKAYFLFAEIAELIAKKGFKWKLNYTPKTTVTGCPVSARLQDIFGKDYRSIKISKTPSHKTGKSYYDLNDIWHVLFFYEDQSCVEEFAEKKLKLSPENVHQFIIAWNALPVGYAMLSLNAIEKINRFLQKGLIYTEAVLLANLPEVIGKELWDSNETFFLENISELIEENRLQKTYLAIVNNLISEHKNLDQKFGYKDNSYRLDAPDRKDIQRAIDEAIGVTKWTELNDTERQRILSVVTDCYQAYFQTTGFARRDIGGERYAVVLSVNQHFYKSDSGYYRMPKLIDTLKEFLVLHFEPSDEKLEKIYHPSEINIYPPAKANPDGVIKLGSPKTGSFKNPMAMRALHELRKLINYLLETQQIDSETRIVVEVARELNDANKRWAIETWQKRREIENAEFAIAIDELVRKGATASSQSSKDIDKMRLWYEQGGEEEVPPISDLKREIKGVRWTDAKKDSYKQIAAQKSAVDKYRLWLEQDCQCIYTGKVISISDLFNDNLVDFEHTIPRSLSFDNSLANQTVCYSYYNRNTKQNKIPFQLSNYDEIFQRLDKWQDRVERIKQQIEYWRTKAKKAVEKTRKDDAIRQRHLWQMELEYWKNKVDRFFMKEVTSGFKNSQKVDTQLISKYAFHYLKTLFEKVDVQKGSITAEFRKIYKLQIPNEKKDRSLHSHHAKDAAVLTLIPIAAKRDAILKTYYEHKERKENFTTEPYKGFKREFVWDIDDSVLINNISTNQSLSPAKRRGVKEYQIDDNGNYIYQLDQNGNPKVATQKDGTPIYKNDHNGLILKDDQGNPIPLKLRAFTRRIATGDCIRGQLHLDTFFGAIRPAKRDAKGFLVTDEAGERVLEEKLKYVVRVPFLYKKDANASGFKSIEDIRKQVVDFGLVQDIERQVEEAGGLKEAFEKGIYLLDKKGQPHGNRIRHIRVWANVSEPLKIKKQTNLSKAEYKQHYYAGNGENIAYGLYENDKKQRGFQLRNLYEASKFGGSLKDMFQNEIETKTPKATVQLKYILTGGLKVIFYQTAVDEIGAIIGESREISKRLYVVDGFEKDGRIRFSYHMDSRSDTELKKLEDIYGKGYWQGFSKVNFEMPTPKLKLSKDNLNMAVEGYDFLIAMDGTVEWL